MIRVHEKLMQNTKPDKRIIETFDIIMHHSRLATSPIQIMQHDNQYTMYQKQYS